jgi:hypothetical protein
MEKLAHKLRSASFNFKYKKGTGWNMQLLMSYYRNIPYKAVPSSNLKMAKSGKVEQK